MKKIYLSIIFILFLGIQTNRMMAHVRLSFPFNTSYMVIGSEVSLSWSIVQDHEQLDWDLFYSVDNGANWIIIEENIPTSQLSYLWTVPDSPTIEAKIKIIQDNTGLDYEDISAVFELRTEPLGIQIETKKIEPIQFVKSFPNPFEKINNIEFLINDNTKVVIDILNLQGSKAAEIINNKLSKGEYKIRFDATGLSPGIYFLRMKAQNQIVTKKIVIR
jgi:hypothetical protein